MAVTATRMDKLETLDEYDEAYHMEQAFCPTMSVEEYESQSVEETDKALKDLIVYLEKNPESYARIVRKKKVEEMENGGVFSYFKVKMMSYLHGEQYPACLVPPEEAQNHLNQLKRGMKRVFEYSQETKATRSSARIAGRKPLSDASPRLNTPNSERTLRSTKRIRVARAQDPQSSPALVPVAKIQPSNVPPPPPPPPPAQQAINVTKIRPPVKKSPKCVTSPPGTDSSDHEFITPPSDSRPLRRKHRRTVSNSSVTSQSSISSLSSIHSELITSNPLKRLRSTQAIRSPGGTPVRPLAEKEHLAHSEPLHKALISVMKRKFRNIRTPSPQSSGHSRVTSPNSTSAFSPLAFTP